MNKILALWAVPRSTSTAFEWMMRQRGDMACLHEPFGEAWYQGEDPLWPRLTADSLRTPGLTLESVWQKLLAMAAEGAVFSKDFPHYIDHMWSPEMLRHFNHSFLIRDPAKTITSMHSKWPDFHEKEVGFTEQRSLFDLITEIEGSPPPVIDSDDLLEDPVRIVRKHWCEAVGIPFIADARLSGNRRNAVAGAGNPRTDEVTAGDRPAMKWIVPYANLFWDNSDGVETVPQPRG